MNEKIRDLFYDLNARIEVYGDYFENWFNEKGILMKTLLGLEARGEKVRRLLECYYDKKREGKYKKNKAVEKKDKEVFYDKKMKFFHDVSSKITTVLLHSTELRDKKKEMRNIAEDWLLEIKGLAVLAIELASTKKCLVTEEFDLDTVTHKTKTILKENLLEL